MIGDLGTRLPLTRSERAAIAERLAAAQHLLRSAQSARGGAALVSPPFSEVAPTLSGEVKGSEAGAPAGHPYDNHFVLCPAASVGGSITGAFSELRDAA